LDPVQNCRYTALSRKLRSRSGSVECLNAVLVLENILSGSDFSRDLLTVGDLNLGLAAQADFLGREILKFKVSLSALKITS